MKAFVWLVIITAALCLLPTSSQAFSLPLGTHKLDWVVPSAASKGSSQVSENGSLRLHFNWLVTLPPCTRFKVDGAKSSEVLTIGIMPDRRSLVAVVDESKGTGKGYDSLYIVPVDPTKNDVISIRRARKINIAVTKAFAHYSGEGSSTSKPLMVKMTDDPKDVVINLPFGEGGEEITKPVGVYAVNLTNGKFSPYPISSPDMFTSVIKFRGKWTKSVTTDEGKFTITSIDCNGNGIFNEDTRHGDEIWWGYQNRSAVQIAFTRKGSTKCWYMHAGIPKLIEGDLYVAELNSVGNEVRIRRYDGGVAKVKAKAVDGFGRPISVSDAQLMGSCSYYAVNDKEYTNIPSGGYSFSMAIVEPGTRSNCMMYVYDLRRSRFQAGESTIISVGGPVRVVPDPKDKEISYVQGAAKSVKLVPMTDNPNAGVEFTSSSSKIKVSLTIKDSKGRVVWTDRVIPRPNIAELYVDMPRTLSQGKYTLVIKTGIDQYQDPVTAEQEVVVKPLTGSGSMALPAGKFKGQWMEPSDGRLTLSKEFPTDLRPMALADVARFTGQKLNNPYWGVQGRVTIIVVSSKPGSNNFDTAYLVPDVPERGSIDLSGATMIVSSQYLDVAYFRQHSDVAYSRQHSDVTYLNYSVPWAVVSFLDAKVKMALGSGSEETVKAVTYGLDVQMVKDESNIIHPGIAFLIPKEFWTYVISSDSGDVTLSLIDGNTNGVFNDEIKDFGHKADRIWFRGGFGRCRYGEFHLLGRVLRLQDKYYEVKVSSSGDTMEIKPYTGPMGKLQLQFVDPKGRERYSWPVDIATSDSLYTLDVDRRNIIDVPVGEYTWNTQFFLGEALSICGTEGFEYHIRSARKINVTEGRTAVFKIGGPVALEPGPEVDSITAKSGGCIEISVAATVGDDNASIFGEIPFKITDDLGNVVVEGHLNIVALNDEKNHFPVYSLRLPKYLKAGEYKLTVSTDTGDYQGVVGAEKKLVVM